MIAHVALAVALALAAPPPARAAGAAADTIAVVAISDPPGPGPELADATRALRNALAERTAGVLAADEVRQRMSSQASGASPSELDRAYAGAVTAYQAGDYEGAARTLRAVIEDLERLPESADTFSQWERAMLRLARAEGSLGRKGEAREVLERLLRADPTAKADPELYPPSFGRQLDELRTALRAAPKRKLAVSAGGRPARIFVEGRDAGAAPLTVSLPPGRYRVSAAIGDVRVSAGTVDVTQEDQTVAIDFALAEAYRPDAGPGLAMSGAQRPKAVVTAGAAMRVDRVLVASVLSDGDVRYLVGSLYDVRRGTMQREGRVRLTGWTPPPAGLTALASFIVSGEPSSLVITKPDLSVAPPKSTIPTRGPGAPQDRSTVMGWSAIAAGALTVGLGAFAVYEGVSSSSSYDDARAMLGPDGRLPVGADIQRYNDLVSAGDSSRSAALATGAGAAACAVTSGILGYISYRQSGTIGPIRF